MKTKFTFNLTEKAAAQTLGVCLKTVQNWRKNGTLPDYLYTKFGAAGHPRVRYCEELLLKWQAHGTDTATLAKLEQQARAQLIKSL